MTTLKTTKAQQEERNLGFQRAVLDSDFSTVQTMLDQGFPVDTVLPLNKTGLYLAVNSGPEMVALFVRAGANLNWTSAQDETPLLRAVDTDQPDLVKALIDAGASHASSMRQAPLWTAVSRGSTESVEYLLKAGASLQLINKHGTTLLHKAIGNGRFDVARQLLEAGMSPNIQDFAGQTPLYYAYTLDSEILATLKEYGANVHSVDKEGETALFTAARGVRIAVFDALVELGADPRARNPKGQTLFDVAFEEKQGAMALHILTHVPEYTPSGVELDAALVDAVRMGSAPLVQHFAHLGADIAQKPGGRTLLQIAPRDRDDMKQLLRALKTSSTIENAIRTDGHNPVAAAPRRVALPNL